MPNFKNLSKCGMQYSVSSIFCSIIFVLIINSDGFSQNDWNWGFYRFSPKLGDCYEIYDQNENVTSFTCRRQANVERQSCIDWIPGDKYCLGLKTPTNETVEFICEDTSEEILSSDYYNSNNCFNVYNANETFKTVCQQKLDDDLIGIITPDNFTLMFESNFCTTSMSIEDRKMYDEFVRSYSFDPGLKSCYKVFNPNQIVSPYTCLNKDVYESCIRQLSKNENCMGIITQNNETIILDCGESGETRNCFKIYTLDGNMHVACEEKVEERCVGVKTPSNLTVLLDCYYCFKPNTTIKHTKYNDSEKNRKYRHFVKSYIDKEFKGESSYSNTIIFEVFNKTDFIEPPDCSDSKRSKEFYAYWLPNTDCYGLALDSNETILLECISKQKEVKPGCFLVVNSEEEKTTVCIRVLDEVCVGITTPRNLSVVLACYPQNKCRSAWKQIEEEYAKKPAESYNFFPDVHDCYEVYDKNQEVTPYNCLKKANPENYACVNRITDNCLGLKFQNETIEFSCGEVHYDKISPCFNVYNLEGNVQQVCQKKFGNYSIGITTPTNNSILFDSHFCHKTSKTLEEIDIYRKFIENFSFDPDVKSCYKIFTRNQEISPDSCLGRDVYESCIHQLNDSNCTGIKTQNNEIVVLHCSDDDGKKNQSGCFKIYTSDNRVHYACQRQLEERCIGVTTPSNLSVLFDCHTCSFPRVEFFRIRVGNNLPRYDDPERKMQRKFIKEALHNYTRGHYAIKDSYQVVTERGSLASKEEMKVHFLRGHGNCRGLTLKNLETVVLECPRIPEKYGCFDIFKPKYDKLRHGPEQEVQIVCLRILEERCVGIITPNNWTVYLNCYFTPLPPNKPASITSVLRPNGRPQRM